MVCVKEESTTAHGNASSGTRRIDGTDDFAYFDEVDPRGIAGEHGACLVRGRLRLGMMCIWRIGPIFGPEGSYFDRANDFRRAQWQHDHDARGAEHGSGDIADRRMRKGI